MKVIFISALLNKQGEHEELAMRFFDALPAFTDQWVRLNNELYKVHTVVVDLDLNATVVELFKIT